MASGGEGAELVSEQEAQAAIQRGEQLAIDDAGSTLVACCRNADPGISNWNGLWHFLAIARHGRHPAMRELCPRKTHELGHDLIEIPAAEPMVTYGGPQVRPVQHCRAHGRQGCGHAELTQQRLDIRSSPAIDLAKGVRRSRVVVRPGSHADLQGGTVAKCVPQQHIEPLFGCLLKLDIGNDRLRRNLAPLLDDTSMERLDVLEVPIEASSRDAELARQDFRLERFETLPRQSREREIDPGLCVKSLGHWCKPYSCVLTTLRRGLIGTIH